jgi:hypothetical protein
MSSMAYTATPPISNCSTISLTDKRFFIHLTLKKRRAAQITAGAPLKGRHEVTNESGPSERRIGEKEVKPQCARHP